MSPWPTVVIHAVFVEQANSVCYLLCSRFISENCIVPPFAEWVMECGKKQKGCCVLGLWQCSASLLKGSHILPVICRLVFQHVLCLLLKEDGFSAFVGFVSQQIKESCMVSICKLNSELYGEHVLGIQNRRGTFLQSLGSFDPFSVMLTRSSYYGENCHWCLWETYVTKPPRTASTE